MSAEMWEQKAFNDSVCVFLHYKIVRNIISECCLLCCYKMLHLVLQGYTKVMLYTVSGWILACPVFGHLQVRFADTSNFRHCLNRDARLSKIRMPILITQPSPLVWTIFNIINLYLCVYKTVQLSIRILNTSIWI